MIAAALIATALLAGPAPPPPDGYNPHRPVTIVDTYIYLPGGPQRQWVYCWRPAHSPAECQAIPHAPFDPALLRKGIG